MAINAFFVTTLLMMALIIVLLQELQFLAPFRALILGPYLAPIAGFAAALFLNVFAAVYLLGRMLFLKDTGRKPAHLERQLRSGDSLSEELAEKLGE